VLDLDLRVEKELVVEAVAGIEDGAEDVETRRRRSTGTRLVLAPEVLEEHLAIAGQGDPGRGAAIDAHGGRGKAERLPTLIRHLDLLGLAAPELLEFRRKHVEAAAQLFNLRVLPLRAGGLLPGRGGRSRRRVRSLLRVSATGGEGQDGDSGQSYRNTEHRDVPSPSKTETQSQNDWLA
jgi:hypothetical protein